MARNLVQGAVINAPTPEEDVECQYQHRVAEWLEACFGNDVAADRRERVHRFLEEALELAQAGGCTREEATILVDYVYSRPIGQVQREVGGVLVTLAGICHAHGLDMTSAGEQELARNEDRITEIRAKRNRKPLGSPLPQ